MLSRYPSILVLPLLLVAVGCDMPTETERRAMSEEVANAKVQPLSATQKEHGEALTANAERIGVFETKLADLTAQTVALESQLAQAQTRIEVLEQEKEAAKPSPTPGRPDPALYYKAEVADSATIGPATALVTIVTWSDFQCPFCKRVSPTITELRKSYGTELRYAFRHNPLAFHKDARSAAIAAEAAREQGKFWEMHDRLFENQRDLNDGNYKKWARELGLNVAQFERDRKSAKIAARVDNDQKAATALGARGTPAFFVNGRFLSGAQPAASFRKLIDEEMTKAKAKVAAGTPAAGVYAATIAAGRTSP